MFNVSLMPDEGKMEVLIAAFKVSRDTHTKIRRLAKKQGISVQAQARLLMMKGLDMVEIRDNGTVTDFKEEIREEVDLLRSIVRDLQGQYGVADPPQKPLRPAKRKVVGRDR